MRREAKADVIFYRTLLNAVTQHVKGGESFVRSSLVAVRDADVREALQKKFIEAGLEVDTIDPYQQDVSFVVDNVNKSQEFIQKTQALQTKKQAAEAKRAAYENDKTNSALYADWEAARKEVDAASRELETVSGRPQRVGKIILVDKMGWTGRDYKTADNKGKIRGVDLVVMGFEEITETDFIQLTRRNRRDTVEGDRFLLVDEIVMNAQLTDMEDKEVRDELTAKWTESEFDASKTAEQYGLPVEVSAPIRAAENIAAGEAVSLADRLALNARMLATRDISDGARHSIYDTVKNRVVTDPFKPMLQLGASFFTPEQLTILQQEFATVNEERGENVDIRLRDIDRSQNGLQGYAADQTRSALDRAEKLWAKILSLDEFKGYGARSQRRMLQGVLSQIRRAAKDLDQTWASEVAERIEKKDPTVETSFGKAKTDAVKKGLAGVWDKIQYAFTSRGELYRVIENTYEVAETIAHENIVRSDAATSGFKFDGKVEMTVLNEQGKEAGSLESHGVLSGGQFYMEFEDKGGLIVGNVELSIGEDSAVLTTESSGSAVQAVITDPARLQALQEAHGINTVLKGHAGTASNGQGMRVSLRPVFEEISRGTNSAEAAKKLNLGYNELKPILMSLYLPPDEESLVRVQTVVDRTASLKDIADAMQIDYNRFLKELKKSVGLFERIKAAVISKAAAPAVRSEDDKAIVARMAAAFEPMARTMPALEKLLGVQLRGETLSAADAETVKKVTTPEIRRALSKIADKMEIDMASVADAALLRTQAAEAAAAGQIAKAALQYQRAIAVADPSEVRETEIEFGGWIAEQASIAKQDILAKSGAERAAAIVSFQFLSKLARGLGERTALPQRFDADHEEIASALEASGDALAAFSIRTEQAALTNRAFDLEDLHARALAQAADSVAAAKTLLADNRAVEARDALFPSVILPAARQISTDLLKTFAEASHQARGLGSVAPDVQPARLNLAAASLLEAVRELTIHQEKISASWMETAAREISDERSWLAQAAVDFMADPTARPAKRFFENVLPEALRVMDKGTISAEDRVIVLELSKQIGPDAEAAVRDVLTVNPSHGQFAGLTLRRNESNLNAAYPGQNIEFSIGMDLRGSLHFNTERVEHDATYQVDLLTGKIVDPKNLAMLATLKKQGRLAPVSFLTKLDLLDTQGANVAEHKQNRAVLFRNAISAWLESYEKPKLGGKEEAFLAQLEEDVETLSADPSAEAKLVYMTPAGSLAYKNPILTEAQYPQIAEKLSEIVSEVSRRTESKRLNPANRNDAVQIFASYKEVIAEKTTLTKVWTRLSEMDGFNEEMSVEELSNLVSDLFVTHELVGHENQKRMMIEDYWDFVARGRNEEGPRDENAFDAKNEVFTHLISGALSRTPAFAIKQLLTNKVLKTSGVGYEKATETAFAYMVRAYRQAGFAKEMGAFETLEKDSQFVELVDAWVKIETAAPGTMRRMTAQAAKNYLVDESKSAGFKAYAAKKGVKDAPARIQSFVDSLGEYQEVEADLLTPYEVLSAPPVRVDAAAIENEIVTRLKAENLDAETVQTDLGFSPQRAAEKAFVQVSLQSTNPAEAVEEIVGDVRTAAQVLRVADAEYAASKRPVLDRAAAAIDGLVSRVRSEYPAVSIPDAPAFAEKVYFLDREEWEKLEITMPDGSTRKLSAGGQAAFLFGAGVVVMPKGYTDNQILGYVLHEFGHMAGNDFVDEVLREGITEWRARTILEQIAGPEAVKEYVGEGDGRYAGEIRYVQKTLKGLDWARIDAAQFSGNPALLGAAALPKTAPEPQGLRFENILSGVDVEAFGIEAGDEPLTASMPGSGEIRRFPLKLASGKTLMMSLPERVEGRDFNVAFASGKSLVVTLPDAEQAQIFRAADALIRDAGLRDEVAPYQMQGTPDDDMFVARPAAETLIDRVNGASQTEMPQIAQAVAAHVDALDRSNVTYGTEDSLLSEIGFAGSARAVALGFDKFIQKDPAAVSIRTALRNDILSANIAQDKKDVLIQALDAAAGARLAAQAQRVRAPEPTPLSETIVLRDSGVTMQFNGKDSPILQVNDTTIRYIDGEGEEQTLDLATPGGMVTATTMLSDLRMMRASATNPAEIAALTAAITILEVAIENARKKKEAEEKAERADDQTPGARLAVPEAPAALQAPQAVAAGTPPPALQIAALRPAEPVASVVSVDDDDRQISQTQNISVRPRAEQAFEGAVLATPDAPAAAAVKNTVRAVESAAAQPVQDAVQTAIAERAAVQPASTPVQSAAPIQAPQTPGVLTNLFGQLQAGGAQAVGLRMEDAPDYLKALMSIAGMEDRELQDIYDRFIDRVANGRISENAHFMDLQNVLRNRLAGKMADKKKAADAARDMVNGVRETIFITGMKLYLNEQIEAGDNHVRVLDYRAMADERGAIKPEFQRTLQALSPALGNRLVVQVPADMDGAPDRVGTVKFIDANGLEEVAAALPTGTKIVAAVQAAQNEAKALEFARQVNGRIDTASIVDPKETGIGSVYLAFAGSRLSEGRQFLLVNVNRNLYNTFRKEFKADSVRYIQRVWQYLADMVRSFTETSVSA